MPDYTPVLNEIERLGAKADQLQRRMDGLSDPYADFWKAAKALVSSTANLVSSSPSRLGENVRKVEKAIGQMQKANAPAGRQNEGVERAARLVANARQRMLDPSTKLPRNLVTGY